MRSSPKYFAITFASIVFLTNCTPITSYHGFNASETLREKLKTQTMTLNEVKSRFGPPSLSETEGESSTLYYISYIKERYAVFSPEITDRKVTALHFQKETLSDFKEYALKDGAIIDINTNETPTYGKDLNVVQQILSNVGRFNSVPGQGQNDGSILGRIPGGL